MGEQSPEQPFLGHVVSRGVERKKGYRSKSEASIKIDNEEHICGESSRNLHSRIGL